VVCTETNSKSSKTTTELGIPVLEGVTLVNGCTALFPEPEQPDISASDPSASSAMRPIEIEFLLQ
jgi:hypothetical protein